MPPELSHAARAALRSASEFAREYGSATVEPEHLLLALLADAADAAGVGSEAGSFRHVAAVAELLAADDQAGNGGSPAADAILRELRQRMPSPGDAVSRGKIPLSPICRQVVTFAGEEAETLGAEFVEPSHLLIGLLREPRGLACGVLTELGYGADTLRRRCGVPDHARPINGSHEGLVDALIDFESGLAYFERAGDARVYVPRNEGWQAHIKRGWDKMHCYLKHPGDDAFHLILNGEIYLQRGDEKFCLDCAQSHGFATRDRLYWQHRQRREHAED
jgi:Clp amino terminal domain, pathogenicity island component